MNIIVTQSFSPPIGEYPAYVEGIWRRYWSTNSAPLHNNLELKLKAYLRRDNLFDAFNAPCARLTDGARATAGYDRKHEQGYAHFNQGGREGPVK